MPPEPTDWELAEKIRMGSESEFEALLGRYKGPVMNFAYRLLGDASDAEDVAMVVFVSAYRSLRNGRARPGSGAFSTWLFQIARHAAIDRLRYRARRPASAQGDPESILSGLPSPFRGADQELTARETEQQIAEAIAGLPEDQRTVLVLSEYENRSQAEIAAVMRTSEKSVESRLYRARQHLRKRLAHLLARHVHGGS